MHVLSAGACNGSAGGSPATNSASPVCQNDVPGPSSWSGGTRRRDGARPAPGRDGGTVWRTDGRGARAPRSGTGCEIGSGGGGGVATSDSPLAATQPWSAAQRFSSAGVGWPAPQYTQAITRATLAMGCALDRGPASRASAPAPRNSGSRLAPTPDSTTIVTFS